LLVERGTALDETVNGQPGDSAALTVEVNTEEVEASLDAADEGLSGCCSSPMK
jgi:hypothetical protein